MQPALEIDMPKAVASLATAVFSPLAPQGGLQQLPEKQIMNFLRNSGLFSQGLMFQQLRQPIKVIGTRQRVRFRPSQTTIIGGIWQCNSADSKLLTKGEKLRNQ